jgi:hypothetical protein
MLIYYVYAYISKSGLPYYIGKGKNNRAYGKHTNVPVPKDKTKIIIVENKLSEIGALALERRLIRWYGRKEDGGILHNKTLGGDGNSAPRSEEHKKKLSILNTGKKLSEDTRRKMSRSRIGKPGRKRSAEENKALSEKMKGKPGRPHTEKAKEQIRMARIGTKRSEETKAKQTANSQKGKTWKVLNGKRVWIENKELINE